MCFIVFLTWFTLLLYEEILPKTVAQKPNLMVMWCLFGITEIIAFKMFWQADIL